MDVFISPRAPPRHAPAREIFGLALLRKADPSSWIGFAWRSLSIMTDRLCFAKPFHRARFDLLLKSNPFILFLLCRKAFFNYGIGFASQSQTISIDWLCFAKLIRHDGLALLRKAFPS